MGFKEDLAAAKVAPRRTADVTVELNGTNHVLRFTQMDGRDWANETVRHPLRPDVQADRSYGYNVNTLTLAVAPKTGQLVQSDGPVDLSDEDWADLFASASGGAIEAIVNTVFALNEYASEGAVEKLKKALAVAVENLPSR